MAAAVRKPLLTAADLAAVVERCQLLSPRSSRMPTSSPPATRALIPQRGAPRGLGGDLV